MSQLKGIEISLKPIASGVNRVLPPGINMVMQQEYANRYLESIGAYPTRENIEFVLNNLAINDALVLPVWARSKIIIIPGMNNKDGVEMGTTLLDVMSENRKDENEDKKPKKNKIVKVVVRDTQDSSDEDQPYKKVQSNYTNLVGRRLSWTTVNTLDLIDPLISVLQVNKRIAETFKVLMKPPEFDTRDLQDSLFNFINSLPDYIPGIKHDQTFQLFKSIRKLLKSKPCMQLYGLLIHFVYWNIIHPTARHTLQALRQTQQPAQGEDLAFADIDLTDTGMLELRSAQGNSLPGGMATGSTRSSAGVERFFLDGVLAGTEEEVQEGTEMNDTEEMVRSRTPSPEPRIKSRANSPLSRGSSMSRGSPGHTARKQFSFRSAHWEENTDSGKNKSVDILRIEREVSGISNYSSRGESFPSYAQSRGRVDSVGFEEEVTTFGDPVRSRPSRAGSPVSTSPTRMPSFLASTQQEQDGFGGLTETSLSAASLPVSVGTEASLSAQEKEQLFMQLEVCLIGLFKQVGRRRSDLVTGRQALVTCCHFVVDEVLTATYPWFATLSTSGADEQHHKVHTPAYLDFRNHGSDWAGAYADNIRQLNLRLRRLVHQGMADIIDPSRLYSSSMLLTSLTGKVESQSMTSKGKARFYATSVATKAVLGDTHSGEARRFLQCGRGTYTVLPGVVEPYHSKNHTHTQSRPDTAPVRSLFGTGAAQLDLRNSSWNARDFAATGMHWESDAKQLQPSSTPNSSVQQRSASSHRIGNRFPDKHERSRPQQVFSAAPSRALEQPRRKDIRRTGSANDAILGASKASTAPTKRIDFGRLFDDQPDVGYFPVIKANSADLSRAAQAVMTQENDWLDVFLPPGSRAGTREDTMNGGASTKIPAGGSASPKRVSSAPAGSRRCLSSHSQSHAQLTSQSAASQRKLMPQQSSGQLQNQFPAAAAPSLFPSGESVGSLSYLSEGRSLAHNKATEMELSLRAKASLMELLVDKTASLYSTEIQTHVVKSRVALLRKT